MAPSWCSAQECFQPAVIAVTLFAGSVVVDIGGVVVGDEAGRDVVAVESSAMVVSLAVVEVFVCDAAVSVEDVLSDPLLQLAASSARGINRLRVR